MNKIFSGRWIFTIVTSVVFGWASVSGILSSEQIASIITIVVAFYFFKGDKPKGA